MRQDDHEGAGAPCGAGEGSAAQVIALYTRHALAWVAARDAGCTHPPVEATWLERFLRLLPPRAAVLDLGCGSGDPIARYLVKSGCSVTGIDASPGLVATFRARLPDQICELVDMRTLRLGRKFDGLIAWDSFFHLTHADQRGMFAVFRAHASPGAALMFTSGSDHGTAIGVLEGEKLHHASFSTDDYLALLREHGFEVVAQINGDLECGGRSVWLAALAR